MLAHSSATHKNPSPFFLLIFWGSTQNLTTQKPFVLPFSWNFGEYTASVQGSMSRKPNQAMLAPSTVACALVGQV